MVTSHSLTPLRETIKVLRSQFWATSGLLISQLEDFASSIEKNDAKKCVYIHAVIPDEIVDQLNESLVILGYEMTMGGLIVKM